MYRSGGWPRRRAGRSCPPGQPQRAGRRETVVAVARFGDAQHDLMRRQVHQTLRCRELGTAHCRLLSSIGPAPDRNDRHSEPCRLSAVAASGCRICVAIHLLLPHDGLEDGLDHITPITIWSCRSPGQHRTKTTSRCWLIRQAVHTPCGVTSFRTQPLCHDRSVTGRFHTSCAVTSFRIIRIRIAIGTRLWFPYALWRDLVSNKKALRVPRLPRRGWVSIRLVA